MSYEAHIAGVGDRPPGRPLMGVAIRAMQRASARELAGRRAAVVAAVRAVAPLRFVNGGGTGSIERTAAEAAVTEVAAGLGPLRPDAVRRLRRLPPRARGAVRAAGRAAARRPHRDAARRRLPGVGRGGRRPAARAVWTEGLKLDRQEGAGEVQTPGARPARGLRVGDRVWMRHAKAGELCERFNELHLVRGEEIVETVPTYRGEGEAFL